MALTKVTSTFIDTISTVQILKSGAVAGDILAYDGPSDSWKPKTPTVGGTVTSVSLSSDGSLEVKGSPITSSGTIGVSVSSIPLNKIAQGGATHGQALRWDNTTNTWKASSLPVSLGTVTNIQMNSPDSSLQITGSPITTTGTFGASILSVGLDKLVKTGATIGNVIAYNGTAWAVNNSIYVAGGKVGIGTTSPSDLLTVTGSINNKSGTLYTGCVNEQVVTAAIDGTTGLVTLNMGVATVFNITLTRSIAKFALSNKPSNSGVYNMTLIITQDITGGRTINWTFDPYSGSNVTIKWAQGFVPIMTTTANKTDIYSLLSYDGGSTWFGFVGGQNF